MTQPILWLILNKLVTEVGSKSLSLIIEYVCFNDAI